MAIMRGTMVVLMMQNDGDDDGSNVKKGEMTSGGDVKMVAAAAAAKLLQSCLTLCDPRDGSPPGSPIPGILKTRTLEWVAISFANA